MSHSFVGGLHRGRDRATPLRSRQVYSMRFALFRWKKPSPFPFRTPPHMRNAVVGKRCGAYTWRRASAARGVFSATASLLHIASAPRDFRPTGLRRAICNAPSFLHVGMPDGASASVDRMLRHQDESLCAPDPCAIRIRHSGGKPSRDFAMRRLFPRRWIF